MNDRIEACPFCNKLAKVFLDEETGVVACVDCFIKLDLEEVV
jgi:hypothetical protein